jgi:beta-carotene ketolase (CrtW type)
MTPSQPRLPYTEGTPERLEAGIVLGVTILLAWSAVTAFALSRPLVGLDDAWWVLPVLALQTWLYTGMFITAHDGMHGVISRRYPWVNNALGSVCTMAFGLMHYRDLYHAHGRHHARPGTADDPDFDDPGDGPPSRWFVRFMVRYSTKGQWVRLFGVFFTLWLGLGVPWSHLVLFWFIPSVASTIQLFVVGTWLPHRAGSGLDATHRARSVDLPPWLSLLACYHFGYHVEHHSYPSVPWWRLPTARQRMTHQRMARQRTMSTQEAA